MKHKKLTDEPVLTIPLTEDRDDWLRAARLQKRAEEGGKEAQRELDRMAENVLTEQ